MVQTAIKSGTNQIHGSAFEFARSSLFDANPNYQFQGASYAAPLPFKRNTFGASLGAPILNEVRAGYNRYTFTNDPVLSGAPISANLGIVNANRTSDLGGGALIGGYQNQLEYTGDYGRYAVPENTYEINDAVSYTRGHHSFKAGGSAIRRDVAFFRPIAGKGFSRSATAISPVGLHPVD